MSNPSTSSSSSRSLPVCGGRRFSRESRDEEEVDFCESLVTFAESVDAVMNEPWDEVGSVDSACLEFPEDRDEPLLLMLKGVEVERKRIKKKRNEFT